MLTKIDENKEVKNHSKLYASITLAVLPSSIVEVNQSVTIQCTFPQTELAAYFFSTKNSLVAFCSLETFEGVCKQGDCARQYNTACPNSTNYRVEYPIPLSWNGESISCRGLFAGNERSNNVTFSVIVPVTSVTLTPTQVTIDAGKNIAFTCQTDYCNPAANITWYKSSIQRIDVTSQATYSTVTDSNGLVRTTSFLQYTGVAGDNGQQVYCKAMNKRDQSVTSIRHTLNIRFIAEVRIFPSRVLNLVVGQRQIFLHCFVENANPEENIQYRWIRSDGPNSSIVSESQTYVIKTVSFDDSGRYICTARNSAGNSSGIIDVSVQFTPLAPKIEYVVCKSTFATVIWTTPYTAYNDVKLQEILQYSELNKTFVNVTNEQQNSNEASIYNQKVTTLKPRTNYTFRVLTSNQYGVTLSNTMSCVTDQERLEESYQGCDKGEIIGGIVGGFALFLISAMCVVILYKLRKRKSTKASTPTDKR
ncbi:neuroglian-like [Saccostrea echinata]|uniref:neuroglian-like n=1 Tax=Saccostrea echinata TaxID=191078 RepID=UPI002A7F8570|nr:neuroglian-like [Saccostrea echinata]